MFTPALARQHLESNATNPHTRHEAPVNVKSTAHPEGEENRISGRQEVDARAGLLEIVLDAFDDLLAHVGAEDDGGC